MPAPRPEPLAYVAGVYRGPIEVSAGSEVPAIVTLTVKDGVITGTYSYGLTRGRFSECELAGTGLTCKWREEKAAGGFDVVFTHDFGSFEGEWDFESGQYGGTWTGSKS